MNHRELHKHLPHWLIISLAAVLSVVFIIVAAGLVFEERYRERVMPGVHVAGMNLGGKTIDEARSEIEGTIMRLSEGVPVRFEDKTIRVPEPIVALSSDVAVETVVFSEQETLRNAWEIGRGEHWFDNAAEQLKALVSRPSLDIALTADGSAIKAVLEKEFSEFEKPARNASVSFENDTPKIVAEEVGRKLRYEPAALRLIAQLRQANLEEVRLEADLDQPEVTAVEAERALPLVEGFLDFPATVLAYEKQTWKLDTRLARGWVGFEKRDGEVMAALDEQKISDYLSSEVAPKVNREPVEARLTMENNRVSVWQAGQDGIEIDLPETARRLAAWPTEKPEKIEVAIATVESAAADATAEELGLREIIGTGTSQFTGSPANRRHNIRTGANALHGLLIKPGEEFSLLKALGEIDARNGYLPELVIKGNRTIPEYGGGLCQIGTTMFRATFGSGLPVTARRNHSYRVSYYEPAGTDATIYDPAPDYKFLNDTGHHILIQARIEGSNLAFDFWGTKDGREVEYTKPVIYNIVSPGPTKIIETTDLPEGQKKCTESAHAGADAYFDYKVTYPDGEVKEKRFTSHYVPWQAVCLVGVKKEPAAPPAGDPPPASSTVTPSVAPATN